MILLMNNYIQVSCLKCKTHTPVLEENSSEYIMSHCCNSETIHTPMKDVEGPPSFFIDIARAKLERTHGAEEAKMVTALWSNMKDLLPEAVETKVAKHILLTFEEHYNL